MDFFQHQDEARKNTSLLMIYYVLAVALIIVGVYFAFAVVLIGIGAGQENAAESRSLWNPELFLWVVLGTVSIVIGGSLLKISQLSGGGAAVAEMLGGRLISYNSSSLAEKKVLNVVEEMAIASGTPVPPVYLLENEDSINAFAAGFTPGDAVIGVTRGCIKELSRDELQGVIAHEFSHILNGDMRMNIRLTGLLNGILVIAMLGYWIMRTSLYSRRGSRDKGAGLSIGMLGILLMIIGYIGVFFGKLIKSAVARQREFLADASAVQYTRNPGGISGALKKIGGLITGSRINNTHAEDISHMFFSNGLKSSFIDMMATHPPLEQRIKRIDPEFAGKIKPQRKTVLYTSQETGATGLADSSRSIVVESEKVISSIGAPDEEHVDYAHNLIQAIPSNILDMAHEPYGARAVIYGMLINKDEEPRKYQLERLAKHADPLVHDKTLEMLPTIESLEKAIRLPLADIAIRSLRALSVSQYKSFMENIDHLVKADERIDLFEYMLQRIITETLKSTFLKSKPPVIQYYDIQGIQLECVSVLSCLAHWGTDNTAGAEKAFSEAVTRLNLKTQATILQKNSCSLDALDQALNTLESASPAIKKMVINACVTCIGADGKISHEEAEILRTISASLSCPMPPIIPDELSQKAA